MKKVPVLMRCICCLGLFFLHSVFGQTVYEVVHS